MPRRCRAQAVRCFCRPALKGSQRQSRAYNVLFLLLRYNSILYSARLEARREDPAFCVCVRAESRFGTGCRMGLGGVLGASWASRRRVDPLAIAAGHREGDAARGGSSFALSVLRCSAIPALAEAGTTSSALRSVAVAGGQVRQEAAPTRTIRLRASRDARRIACAELHG